MRQLELYAVSHLLLAEVERCHIGIAVEHHHGLEQSQRGEVPAGGCAGRQDRVQVAEGGRADA